MKEQHIIKTFVVILFSFVVNTKLLAQNSLYKNSFKASKEYEDILEKIASTYNLERKYLNIELRKVTQGIASSYFDPEKHNRVIFLNENYFNYFSRNDAVCKYDEISDKSLAKEFLVAGVLAHEFAHHMLGHTLNDNTKKEQEVRADEISGLIMGHYPNDKNTEPSYATLYARCLSNKHLAAGNYKSPEERAVDIGRGWFISKLDNYVLNDIRDKLIKSIEKISEKVRNETSITQHNPEKKIENQLEPLLKKYDSTKIQIKAKIDTANIGNLLRNYFQNAKSKNDTLQKIDSLKITFKNFADETIDTFQLIDFKPASKQFESMNDDISKKRELLVEANNKITKFREAVENNSEINKHNSSKLVDKNMETYDYCFFSKHSFYFDTSLLNKNTFPIKYKNVESVAPDIETGINIKRFDKLSEKEFGENFKNIKFMQGESITLNAIKGKYKYYFEALEQKYLIDVEGWIWKADLYNDSKLYVVLQPTKCENKQNQKK